MERRVCRFFPLGTCKKGSNCNFSHETSQQQQQQPQSSDMRGGGGGMNMNMNMGMTDENIAQQQQQQQQFKKKNYEKNEPKICKFFQEGNCKHQNCFSIHAYSQHLDHVIFDEDFHSKPIVGMCQISK